ncbi:hypothetical protein DAPPUDRAFT_111188 [Daphnia pulex]|uniref:Uncharacterized protein n=1 Tax=Daphnia pulex TaxID=6669 RepID=E9H8G7_DAPPU|nr:hypothetical protein DAPPUDRAFT_111188 [Daphnia pulex]|eukprot:EFX71983.1 hypothetical protein DAPPUDRAFT_111188 [Daphnia pulex]
MTLASTNAKAKSNARVTATKNPPPVIENAAQGSKRDSAATATGTQARVTNSKTAVKNADVLRTTHHRREFSNDGRKQHYRMRLRTRYTTRRGYFFGSFDTIDTMVTSVTTVDECRQLVKSHVCDGNKMTKLNENAYEFKGNPTQKGTWMQEGLQTQNNTTCLESTNKGTNAWCLLFGGLQRQTSRGGKLLTNKDKPAVDIERRKTSGKTEEIGPLLAQHHQYIEDKTLGREIALLKEIKEIYCGNLQLRKYTTQLLAENNGLQAAMANNLPICSRLKPNGVHLIIQQCEAKNVTIRGQKTKCGFEPRFNNYTVGRDGYSLHPFQECFWKDQIINLNGHSYSWNSTSENYTRVYLTYHLATTTYNKSSQISMTTS